LLKDKDLGQEMINTFFIGKFEDATDDVREAFLLLFGNTVVKAVTEVRSTCGDVGLKSYATLVSCADIAHILMVNILETWQKVAPKKHPPGQEDCSDSNKGRPFGTQNIENHWRTFNSYANQELERRRVVGIAQSNDGPTTSRRTNKTSDSESDEDTAVQAGQQQEVYNPGNKEDLETWYQAVVDRINEVAPPRAKKKKADEPLSVFDFDLKNAPIGDDLSMFDALENEIIAVAI
jgi:hypothetical protein